MTQNLHSSRQEVLKSDDTPFGHAAWPRKKYQSNQQLERPVMWTQESRDNIATKVIWSDKTTRWTSWREKKISNSHCASHGTNTSVHSGSYLLAGACGSVVLLAMMQRNALWMGTYSSQPRSMDLFWEFFCSLFRDQRSNFGLFPFLLHLVQKPNCLNVFQPLKPFCCETLAVRLCIDTGFTLGPLPVYWGRGFGSATLCPEDL